MASSQKFSRRSLRLQALLMGSHYKVDIVWDPKATTASTNGKKITLPALAHTGSEEDAELLEGLFDHEVGHCRFSDFDIIQKIAQKLGPIGQRLHNSIEDVYEESMMGGIYPGCRKSLRRVEEIFIKRDMYKHKEEMDPPNALNIGIYSMLRMNVLKHPSQEVFDAVHPQMVKHFGQEMTSKVLEIAAKTAFAKSTEDTAGITAAIIRLIEDSIKESKENQPQPQSGQQQAPDQDQNGGQGAQSGQQQGQDQDGNGSQSGQQQASSAQGAGQQSQQPGKESNQDPVNSLTKGQIDALQSALDATLDEIKDVSTDSNAVTAMEQSGALDKMSSRGKGANSVHDVKEHRGERDADWRKNAESSAQPLFVRMGSKLESLLESIKEEDEQKASSGRKMVRDYGEKLASGSFKVFRRRDEAEQINTAVSILIDYSASMHADFDGKTRMDAAWDTCFAAGKVMYQHDIPYSMTGFAGDICHLKDFEDGPNAITNPKGNAGGTMTHEGVLAAGYPLLARSEEKKLLIVITDGLPASSDAAAANIGELQRNGVHVAVVFINEDDYGTKSFSDELISAGCTYAMAKTCDDLSNAVFSAVKQSMH